MKRALMAIVGILAVFASANGVFAFSNTIALHDPGSRYLTSGPFTAKVMENTPDGLVGDPVTGGIEFTTFCLEKTEYFYAWDTPYEYTIADYADAGSYNLDTTTPGKDYLNPMSAFLYYSFRMNTTAYNKTALQAAFWHIEDELKITSPVTGSIEETALSYVTAAANAHWTGIGPVVVLNLYDEAHGKLQSQLGLTAVPEPATLLLFGFGLLGLAGVGRKLQPAK
jgi:hypothetical protein